jgi:hypothetical protein
MTGPTQRQRVLRLLEQRGELGITQGDFLLPDVADGGTPITRVGARIEELRRRGLTIETAGRRNAFSVYIFRPALRPVIAQAATQQLDLPTSQASPPRSAVLGWDER